MQRISFKNRIALYYISITGILIFLVFTVIYFTVKWSVFNHINADIQTEVSTHLNEIHLENGKIILNNEDEWKEREHNSVNVNPVFVAYIDNQNRIIAKSPNLKSHVLEFYNKHGVKSFDVKFQNFIIRQVQIPIQSAKHTVGYLLVAVPINDSIVLLKKLSEVLLISSPIILLFLFFTARFFAGNSIKPIKSIIETSNEITKDNLNTRIELPIIKDELYVLSKAINQLLDRIEAAVNREKQFTSDASHELRTPLTIIKGTLEVLVRKKRSIEEYEEKINFTVSEVDRLNHLVEQLLILARFENQKHSLALRNINLNSFLETVIEKASEKAFDKKIIIETNFESNFDIKTDEYLLNIILNNLLSNAIKYSKSTEAEINLSLYHKSGKTVFEIKDNGIGISESDLQNVFNPFFRSKSHYQSDIKGNGLGLSIVKRCCELLSIEIKIESKYGKGTL